MATVTDVCRVISDCLSIPLSEARQCAHRLRVAGYLPEGGRGRYAPQIGSRDAAAILIAVLGRIEFPAVKAATALERIAHLVTPRPIITLHGEGGQFVVTVPGTYWDTLTLVLERSRDERTEKLNRLVIGEFGITVYGEDILAWLCVRRRFLHRVERTIPDPLTSMVANYLSQKRDEDSTDNEEYLPDRRVPYSATLKEDFYNEPRKEYAIQYSRIIPALGEALGPIDPEADFVADAVMAAKSRFGPPYAENTEVFKGTKKTETDTARGANHEPVIDEARSPKTNQGSGGPATTTANGSVAQAKNESQ